MLRTDYSQASQQGEIVALTHFPYLLYVNNIKQDCSKFNQILKNAAMSVPSSTFCPP